MAETLATVVEAGAQVLNPVSTRVLTLVLVEEGKATASSSVVVAAALVAMEVDTMLMVVSDTMATATTRATMEPVVLVDHMTEASVVGEVVVAGTTAGLVNIKSWGRSLCQPAIPSIRTTWEGSLLSQASRWGRPSWGTCWPDRESIILYPTQSSRRGHRRRQGKGRNQYSRGLLPIPRG